MRVFIYGWFALRVLRWEEVEGDNKIRNDFFKSKIDYRAAVSSKWRWGLKWKAIIRLERGAQKLLLRPLKMMHLLRDLCGEEVESNCSIFGGVLNPKLRISNNKQYPLQKSQYSKQTSFRVCFELRYLNLFVVWCLLYMKYNFSAIEYTKSTELFSLCVLCDLAG